MDPQGANLHLTAKIVGSYLRHHTVGATELPGLITSVHRALTEVGRPIPPEVPLTPAVSVRQSVRQDSVVCLNCGYRGKTLRRHDRQRDRRIIPSFRSPILERVPGRISGC